MSRNDSKTFFDAPSRLARHYDSAAHAQTSLGKRLEWVSDEQFDRIWKVYRLVAAALVALVLLGIAGQHLYHAVENQMRELREEILVTLEKKGYAPQESRPEAFVGLEEAFWPWELSEMADRAKRMKNRHVWLQQDNPVEGGYLDYLRKSGRSFDPKEASAWNANHWRQAPARKRMPRMG